MTFDPNELLARLVTVAPIFLFSLVFHEYAHAVVAQRLGDRLAAWTGRLTLDPRVHLEPFGSILLPLAGLTLGWWNGGPGLLFGWARPVPVNPRDLTNRSRDMALIALAGPVANMLLFCVCALIIRGLAAGGAIPTAGLAGAAAEMAAFGVYINAILALFNLLPLPPLDGSKIIAWLLGPELGARLLGLQPGIAMMALVIVVIGGWLSTPLWVVLGWADRLAGHPLGTFLF